MTRDEAWKNVPKLGFGLMRLPNDDDVVRMDEVIEMTDRFLRAGFTYFDTAYGYMHRQSEPTVREALVKRHPRESFLLATKLPVWMLKEPGDMRRIFDEQRANTGVAYFDYYLLHAVMADRLETLDKLDAWGFLRSLKESGEAKNVGMSYHDNAERLETILSAHPEIEFVQLQINYLDWDDENVQSRACYEVCRKHGLPVIVMEPVKGGSLAALPEAIRTPFTALDEGASDASWAIRYAASLEGVITVLSGMSSVPQMEDNLRTMTSFRALNEAERAAVGEVVAKLNAIDTVKCTGCAYCEAGCPQKIAIPQFFETYNGYLRFGGLDKARAGAARIQKARGGAPGDCVACGQCESVCPQHLPIVELLQRVAQTLS